MRTLLATLGALIFMLSTVPYVIDIMRHKTKPNIVSWLTWTILTGVATAATFANHEPRTAFLTLGSTISTFLVVLFGLRHAIAKVTIFDVFCQAGAIVGLILWLIFNSPTIAIVAALCIDFIGWLPTLRHSWLHPGEETWQTFAWCVLASALTLLSLTDFNLSSLAYPIYLLLADGALTLVVLYRHQRSALSTQR